MYASTYLGVPVSGGVVVGCCPVGASSLAIRMLSLKFTTVAWATVAVIPGEETRGIGRYDTSKKRHGVGREDDEGCVNRTQLRREASEGAASNKGSVAWCVGYGHLYPPTRSVCAAPILHSRRGWHQLANQVKADVFVLLCGNMIVVESHNFCTPEWICR